MRIKSFFVRPLIFTCILTLAFSKIAISAEGETVGVNFKNLTLQQALAKAKSENKKGVFIHCYAEWCHYCMYMKDSVYTDKEVADLVNKDFISIKMDMEKEGKSLNEEVLKIHTYPGLVFYDLNGEIMHRAAGRKFKQPFLDLVKDALDTNKQMRTYERKYKTGTGTPYEVMFYFRMLETSGMTAQPYINEYLMKQSDSAFVTQNCWRIIYDIIKDPTMAVVNRVLDMRKELGQIYTDDSVTNKMIILHNYYLSQFVQQLDSVGYEKAKKNILANKRLADLSQLICAYADLNKLKLRFEYDKYRVEGPKFIEKYAMKDPRRINDVCGVLYERFSGDTVLMQRVEKWLEHSMKQKEIYKGSHVLASVYTVLGKQDLAIKTAENAIELAKKTNADYKQTTALLDRLNEMKSSKK